MNRPDLSAGQHGNHDFWDARHVDRHTVAFFHAHRFEHVGELIDLTVERKIGVGAHAAAFAHPDQRQFVAPLRALMAVQGVVNDVALGSNEPAEEGRVAIIQNFFPGLIPF